MRDIDLKLHKAVETGELGEISQLIKKGADVNSLHSNGYSPLMHAARAWECTPEQRIQTVKTLICNGANPAYVAPDKYQAITLAHDIEVVCLCIGAGVRVTQEMAEDLMYRFNGNIKMLDLLHNLGVEPVAWVDSERQIYYRICAYEGYNLFNDELERAIPYLRSVFESLVNYKKYDPDSTWTSDDNKECTLYAINRINDVLILSFQENRKSERTVAQITLEQYIEFWKRIGVSVIQPVEYHPFLCEIYEVQECPETDQQLEIIKTLWPCLMFGGLLLSRSGVCIKASPHLMSRQIAEESTLYWCHWRYNRSTADLSDGWGSNSQWSTRFRLDYWIDDSLYYNVNHQTCTAGNEDDDLPEERRMELLRYRSFIKHPEALDCYPYDYLAIEKYFSMDAFDL